MPNETKNETPHDASLTSKQLLAIDIITGMGTGSCLAGFFNPWDRALYKSVKEKVPFLRWSNFKSPYQGVSQAIVQRSFSWGLYYILQGEFKIHVKPFLSNELKLSESSSQFIIGLTIGSLSGAMTNGISAVKYHTWGKDDRKFLSSIYEMYSKGGIKPFFKGALATSNRDMVFGSVYELLRQRLALVFSPDGKPTKKVKFASDMISGTFATILSSPFNYVRNVKYATPPGFKTPTTKMALSDLLQQSKELDTLNRFKFFQHRLRIGWGTARVATGIAFGQLAFDYSRAELSKKL